MTAILNRTQPLPRYRAELYRQASRVLLHEWDASRSLPSDTFARRDKEALLCELACAMQQSGGNLIEQMRLVDLISAFLRKRRVADPYDKATSLVSQLTERNFILCFAGGDRFSFVHRTFLEYFCAAWFVDRFEKKQTLALEDLKRDVFGRRWKDETWHEVLRLIAGMLDEEKSEELIVFLMEQDGRYDRFANLFLAAECLSEAPNRALMPETDQRLWRIFVEQAVRYTLRYYAFVYFQHEIAQPREKAVHLLASVWPNEATYQWLRSAAAGDKDTVVRVAAVRELSRRWKHNAETLPLLKECATSDRVWDVQQAALEELARGWKDEPDTLSVVRALGQAADIRSDVRCAAIRQLAQQWNDHPATLPLLKECVCDPDHMVAGAAIEELARRWKNEAETAVILKACAHSENRWERLFATLALARWRQDEPDILRIVKAFISEESPLGGDQVLRELARRRKDDAEMRAWVKEWARSNESPGMRFAALRQFALWKDDAEALAIVKERARLDKDRTVRTGAVQEFARGWRNDAQTVPTLKAWAQSHQHSDVSIAAVRELARGWKHDPETLGFLKECARCAAQDKVRSAAIEQLEHGWGADPEVIALSAQSRTEHT